MLFPLSTAVLLLTGFHIPEGSGGLAMPERWSATGEETGTFGATLAAEHSLLPDLVKGHLVTLGASYALPRSFSLGVEVSPFNLVRGVAVFGRWHLRLGWLWLAPLVGFEFLGGNTGKVGDPESAGEESPVFVANLAIPAVDLGVSASVGWRWLRVTLSLGATAAWLGASTVQCVPDTMGFHCDRSAVAPAPMGGLDLGARWLAAVRFGPQAVGLNVHFGGPFVRYWDPAYPQDDFFGVGVDGHWPG